MKIATGQAIEYMGNLYCYIKGKLYVFQKYDSSWYLVRQAPDGLELEQKPCDCPTQLLVCRGCQCGGV